MRIVFAAALGIVVLATATKVASEEPAPTPQQVFETLKGLEGRWEGNVMTTDGPAAAVEYRVTAAGNTVMEVMFPGSEHEMVSTLR